MQIFDNYVWKSSFDELYDDKGDVRKYWKDIVDNIESKGLDLLEEKQQEINWHLEDNGVTYNIYNDNDKHTSRRWGLDPIPFVIEEAEWEETKKGLEQRAKLLNLIFKDLYSEQKLIKENIVPAEVIFGHKGFSTEVFDFGGKEDFNLYYYAT
nr:circularly permuted type 2 ATP-grasp protein [bacterium]